MFAWLRLIRWTNLLIILFTQGMVWWCLLVPLKGWAGTPLLLTPVNFLLLSLSTVLIAAAGYIINDYFDIRIDAINKPGKVILEKRIPRRMAIIVHSVLNVAALFLAWLVASEAHHPEWLLLQLLCTLLLWRYSTTYKRQFMTGNVIVALMTALTVLVVVVYEPALYPYFHRPPFMETSLAYLYPNPVHVACIFTFFAFFMTWMREIVKDMEDLKGDIEEGCTTMPIRWGLQRASRFTQLLGVLVMLPLTLAVTQLYLAGFALAAGYTLLFLILPLALWVYRLPRYADTRHYARSSRQLKLFMVAGISALFLMYLQVHNYHL